MSQFAHLQRLLDLTFPGVELRFCDRGYYYLADRIRGADSGAVNPWLLQPATPESAVVTGEARTNYATIARFVGIDENGDECAIEPCADRVIGTLYHMFTGGQAAFVDEQIDRLDSLEEGVQAENNRQEREIFEEASESAWNRHGKGVIYSSSAGVTSPKKASRDLSKKFDDEQQLDRESMTGGVAS